MIDYVWICHYCAASNAAGTERCASCHRPPVAGMAKIEAVNSAPKLPAYAGLLAAGVILIKLAGTPLLAVLFRMLATPECAICFALFGVALMFGLPILQTWKNRSAPVEIVHAEQKFRRAWPARSIRPTCKHPK